MKLRVLMIGPYPLFLVIYFGALSLVSPTWYGSTRDSVSRVLVRLAVRARGVVCVG